VVPLAGEADTVKSGVGGGGAAELTTKVTVVEWVVVPHVPVIVSV
jgi:hypothetical protein